MKKKWIVLMIMSVLLLLAACGETSPEPTTEPVEPTAIVESETAVEPVEEGAVVAVEETNGRQFVPMGHYSFEPVEAYQWEIADAQMFMANQDGSIMISVVGVPANENTPEMIMEDFISGMEETGSGTLERGEESVIVIDGVDATAVNLSGDLFDSPMEGQAVLVQPTEDWAIFMLALGSLSENEAQWSEIGQPLFTDMLGTMEFLDKTAVAEQLVASSDEQCPIAIDPTYGYSEDNPVRVGDGAENGSARATAYLDNLIDPVGIPITYRLSDSSPHGDDVISIYEIGSPMVEEMINLYIDQHNYSELMAPVGFSCEQAFPISAP